jgi:hypothetical protein
MDDPGRHLASEHVGLSHEALYADLSGRRNVELTAECYAPCP